MADSFVFSNFAVGALQTAIDQFSTVAYISPDDVDRFPILVGGTKFPIILADNADNVEVCYVTSLSSTGEMVLERGREGTGALSWTAGTLVEHTITAATILAAVGLTPKGTWSAATNYVARDVVVHNDISYLAVQASLNQVPAPGSAYWQSFYVPPGVSASALSRQGDWNSGTTYAIGAVVIYMGRIWASLSAGNINHVPTDPAWWAPLAPLGTTPAFRGHLTTSGAVDNYVVTPSPIITALYDGMVLTVVFTNPNTTAATLQINALAPVPLRPKKGVNFGAGEIIANAPYEFIYFSGSNEFVAVGAPVFEKKLADNDTLNTTQNSRLTTIENYKKYVPVGAVMDFAGSEPNVPAGWLLCIGQAISRVTYATLFNIIGTQFGIGDGSTTFNLPDTRGRVVAGADNMGGAAAGRLTGYVRGSVGGAQTVTLSSGEIPIHDHPVSATDDNDHAHSYDKAAVSATQQVSGGGGPFVVSGIGYNNVSTGAGRAAGLTVDVGNAGSGLPHANVQPTIAFNKIIFTGV